MVLRRAAAHDLEDLVDLLAADQLGASRDGITTVENLEAYQRAFARIDQDPAQLLLTAVTPEGRVVATLQLSFIPGLARRGALRAQIEAVRVAADLRGSGLGTQLLQWSIDEARRRGRTLVQLTIDPAPVGQRCAGRGSTTGTWRCGGRCAAGRVHRLSRTRSPRRAHQACEPVSKKPQ
ncbi:MAG: hypothetical protein QOE51_2482, partial [Actinoplanes sp.]|nr:hypothetical protein [Actinoplanes sp.]